MGWKKVDQGSEHLGQMRTVEEEKAPCPLSTSSDLAAQVTMAGYILLSLRSDPRRAEDLTE